jgi:CBS domain containing-hemolysin-like protein
MEAVLLSITPAYIAQQEQDNPKRGAELNKLKKDIESPLAAILSLNTIAHTLGAAGAGAQAAYIFGDKYVGIISAVLTLLILVFSEIIPKTLGAVYWKQLTGYVLISLRFTTFSMIPLVKMSNVITKMITGEKKSEKIDKGEFKALMEKAVSEGMFNVQESNILTNLFIFRKLPVSNIMTPRTVIYAFDEETPVKDIIAENPDMVFSRVPLYKENTDSITGFVLKSDILLAAVEGKTEDKLKTLKREIKAVPESLSVFTFFDEMVKEGHHIAVIVDEYGGTAGVATLEDIIETLTGFEIVDEKDIVHDMQKLAMLRWKKRAKNMGITVEED